MDETAELFRLIGLKLPADGGEEAQMDPEEEGTRRIWKK